MGSKLGEAMGDRALTAWWGCGHWPGNGKKAI